VGKGASIEVVAKSDEGAFLNVNMGSFNMVLVDESDVDDVSAQPTNVLFAGQGESNVINQSLMSKVIPQIVILSVGPRDAKGRPEFEVTDLFDDVSVFRTDINGWIRVSTDGMSIWVDIENNY
jgi:beta-lactamase superfamily II metal-dependent hydrolase